MIKFSIVVLLADEHLLALDLSVFASPSGGFLARLCTRSVVTTTVVEIDPWSKTREHFE